jgi:signal transduction histidine kinase
MNKLLIGAVVFASLIGVPAFAADRANKAEAEAMVKKAVSHLKSKGEAAYADFTAPNKTFIDRDLYIVVYDLDGICLAHGQIATQVGKDLTNLKDSDGKLFIKERAELARSKGTFWQDYKFTDPITKSIMPKQTYCEKVDKVAVCAGIYK